MKLKTIVCSGANESTEISSLLAMMKKYPKAELGIQMSGKKASFGTARYWWFQDLCREIHIQKLEIPVALHINSDWVEDFCQGNCASELLGMLHYMQSYGKTCVRRVQLNFKIGREKEPNMKKMLNLMREFPFYRFILSYNQANESYIKELYNRRVRFDCLYDGSFGEGVMPDTRLAPPFGEDVFQGYAGGLSPENVRQELDKIAQVVPEDREIFIDAEGKLKGEDGKFSTEKAEKYIRAAYSWK